MMIPKREQRSISYAFESRGGRRDADKSQLAHHVDVGRQRLSWNSPERVRGPLGASRNIPMRRRRALCDSYSFLSIILVLTCILALASAEDEQQEEEQDDAFDDDDYYAKDEYYANATSGGGKEEWYMLLVFSLFFGFFITLFGAFIGYFSVLEDSLMRRYKREGTSVFAKVVSSEFARGGGQVSIFAKQRDNPEYIAFCEYNCKMTEHYTVGIRKQFKSRQSDFSSNPRPGTEGVLLSIKMAISRSLSKRSVAPQQQQPYYANTSDGTNNNNETNFCGDEDPWQLDLNPIDDGTTRQYLELLILPGKERSAYPRKAVERACSLRYRLSTIGLVTFGLALATFCTHLAANDVLALEHGAHRIIGWYAIAAFLLLISLEVPLIQYCCHTIFVDALREEYLESGEYIPLQCDDSSISSGSDMYLCMSPTNISAASSIV